ncbi:MAG: hypothetical protein PHG84_04510 [Endomicrobiaceae bacterium]|nr:hypothetical protein [Endomicrobiaceae bacterium]MDD3053645.1 hypothetical protein [Endomicrobiaceae bacterium]MDD3922660.1 hypothetical protein [Endomicrobiaceae bacterium]
MKKCIVIILSFMLSLSVFNLQFNQNEKIEDGIFAGISNIFEVQYELYRQTKNIVINLSDTIINDLTLSTNTEKNNKLFIDNNAFFITNISNIYFMPFRLLFISATKESLYNNSQINFIFLLFSFIFIFLLGYLGLLRVFWILAIKSYRKTKQSIRYSILYALFYYLGVF